VFADNNMVGRWGAAGEVRQVEILRAYTVNSTDGALSLSSDGALLGSRRLY